MTEEILTAIVPEELARQRLDSVLVELFPGYSRSRLQLWIKAGRVLLNGKTSKPKHKVQGLETIEVRIEHETVDEVCQPQSIDLDIVYEDEHVIVINKPIGLVVHPAVGHRDGTLQNALLNHDNSLAEVPRAGIVHRLDKNTSGLLVIARDLKVHKNLVDQLQARTVHREYQAIVLGVMTAGGTVDEPIGRHSKDRKKMVVKEGAKEAITHYRVSERYRGHTRVKVNLETGRTHQIRVHMSHINYPIVGDAAYGGRLKLPRGASDELKDKLKEFKRQALHAGRLGLQHPATNEYQEWQAPMPEDMWQLIEVLRKDAEEVEVDPYHGIY